MVVLMEKGFVESNIKRVEESLSASGLKTERIVGEERTIVLAIGKINEGEDFINHLLSLSGVAEINKISKPYKLASKEMGNGNKVVIRGRIKENESKIYLDRKNSIMIAGPCSVESIEQMEKTAMFLKGIGVKAIRAGAFKPRTGPRNFEGLREEGLKILHELRKKYGMLIVTELLSEKHAEMFLDYVDVVQIGTRNMQNFELLKTAGEMNIPVILKRGMSATYEEWLLAAEYILDRQKEKAVILCERGIRTFETATRNALDINAVPAIKSLSWLPIIVDPSHATGKRAFVYDMACASIAAGADGLIVEVHPKPEEALTDGSQSLSFDDYIPLYHTAKKIAETIGKTIV